MQAELLAHFAQASSIWVLLFGSGFPNKAGNMDRAKASIKVTEDDGRCEALAGAEAAA